MNEVTYSLVGVDAGVSCCTCQVFPLSEWDMLSIRVFKALRQTEVDDINCVLGPLSASNQEVIWLDVPMNNPFFMYLLYPFDLNIQIIMGVSYHLNGYEQDSL